MWVKLPSLPFEYWSSYFFKLVGNTLGTHLETDFSYLQSIVYCVGRVLVLLDFRNGLPADLVIKKGNSKLCQPLDYLGLPFRCYRCHVHGHLANECSLPFNKKSFSVSSKIFWKAMNCESNLEAKEVKVLEEISEDLNLSHQSLEGLDIDSLS